MTLTNDQKAALYDELIADIRDLKDYAKVELAKANITRYGDEIPKGHYSVWNKRIIHCESELLLCVHLLEENQNRIDAVNQKETN